MATDERILRAMLRFGIDRPSAAETKAGLDSIRGGLTAVERQAAATRQQFQQLKTAGRELRQVGLEIGLVGAAIGGPLLAAAKSFVDANQKSSYIAQQWLRDTNSMTASYQRIGGVVAKELLPAMDHAALLVDKLAAFAEQNPGLVKMALGASGSLVAAGAGLVVLGQATQTAANLALLAGMLGKGLGVTAGAAAGAVGAAAVGAAVVGGSIGAAGNVRPIWGGPTPWEAVGQAVDFAAGKLGEFGSMLGFVASGQRSFPQPRWATPAAAATAIDPHFIAQALLAASVANRTATAAQAAVPAFMQYQAAQTANTDQFKSNDSSIRLNYLKQFEDAQFTYQSNRTRQIKDFNKNEAQIEAAYNKARLLQLRDFEQSQARAEASFNESQAAAAAAHATDMARLAQDHAKAVLQLDGDHADRMRALAAAGDALGFDKEQRAYEKEKAAQESQYQTDVDRRNADYATQTADALKAFTEQRAQQQADFDQQLADAKAAHDDQKAQRKAQFDQQLTDEATAWGARRLQMKSQFDLDLAANVAQYKSISAALKTNLIATLDPILTGMTKIAGQKFQAASDEFGKFLVGLQSQIGGGPGYCGPGYHWDPKTKSCVKDPPRSAAGGYVGYGVRLLGEEGPEYVLNNATVSAAERLTGGPLTQERILASLSRSNSATVNMGGINVNGGGGAAGLLAQVREMVDSKLVSAFDQFGEMLDAP